MGTNFRSSYVFGGMSVNQLAVSANWHTGKSVSEALILESINLQYDERLFIEFPEKYKFRTCCVQILF